MSRNAHGPKARPIPSRTGWSRPAVRQEAAIAFGDFCPKDHAAVNSLIVRLRSPDQTLHEALSIVERLVTRHPELRDGFVSLIEPLARGEREQIRERAGQFWRAVEEFLIDQLFGKSWRVSSIGGWARERGDRLRSCGHFPPRTSIRLKSPDSRLRSYLRLVRRPLFCEPLPAPTACERNCSADLEARALRRRTCKTLFGGLGASLH